MDRRGMPDLRVGITPPPRQDGGAVDDEITRPDEPTADGNLHCQNEQRLACRSSGSLFTLPLLGSRRDTRLTMSIKGQPACERQGRSTAQPIVHILVREAPQRPEQGNQQQRFLGVDSWVASRTSGQRRWTPSIRQVYREPTEGKQMEAGDQGQSIQV